MAANSYIRAAQHRHYFNSYELAVLGVVCVVLGTGLGDLTRAQATAYVNLFYNAPHPERGDPSRALARMRLAGAALSTFLRMEFGMLASVPGFSDEVTKIVEGDGEETDGCGDAVHSIMRDLQAILHMAKRGARP